MRPARTRRRIARGRRIGLLLAIAFGAEAGAPFESTLYDGEDGATCEYYNAGARLEWRHRQGDWHDAVDAAQGTRPYAQASVRPADDGQAARFDVTRLVQESLEAKRRNDGFIVRGISGNGTATFHSREAQSDSLRPRLVVKVAGRTEQVLPASADTTLDCTTFTSLGHRPTLAAAQDRSLAIRFDLARLDTTAIERATLELVASKIYGNVTLGVFALQSPLPSRLARVTASNGLAARYPRDRGLAADPDVIMATGFDTPAWRTSWSYVHPRSAIEIVRDGRVAGFERLDGAALGVKIAAGQNLGLDMGYGFKDKTGAEPEEIYFRYYLRLGSDWKPSVEGGKLPGISATRSSAGWGGRRSDGTGGWSMRGLFHKLPASPNPMRDITTIGTYAYHADMKDHWGDAWMWTRDGSGLLERNRWYCIEQYFKVNEPGRKDGVMRAWVDGQLAFERTGVHVRDNAALGIEQIWMNVYHGGSAPAPGDMHLFIDNVVIARKYIGPMQQ